MVTTTTGTIQFTGNRSGIKYNISAFVDDVTATFLPLNLNGIAVTAGKNFWVAPEDVTLTDVSFLTGPTVIKVLVPFIDDGLAPGKVTLFSNTLSTLNARQFASLTVMKGHQFQMQAI